MVVQNSHPLKNLDTLAPITNTPSITRLASTKRVFHDGHDQQLVKQLPIPFSVVKVSSKIASRWFVAWYSPVVRQRSVERRCLGRVYPTHSPHQKKPIKRKSSCAPRKDTEPTLKKEKKRKKENWNKRKERREEREGVW